MSYLYNEMGMALPADQVRSVAHRFTVTLSTDTCNRCRICVENKWSVRFKN